jgi:hypothetical protein
MKQSSRYQQDQTIEHRSLSSRPRRSTPSVTISSPRPRSRNMASQQATSPLSLLALALLPLSAGQGVAPLLKAIEGNNPSQINMALKSTHPKLLNEVDAAGTRPRRKGRHARSRHHRRMEPRSPRHEPVVARGVPLSWCLVPCSLQLPGSARSCPMLHARSTAQA